MSTENPINATFLYDKQPVRITSRKGEAHLLRVTHDTVEDWMPLVVLTSWNGTSVLGFKHPDDGAVDEPFTLWCAFVLLGGEPQFVQVEPGKIRAVAAPRMAVPFSLLSPVHLEIPAGTGVMFLHRQHPHVQKAYVDIVLAQVDPARIVPAGANNGGLVIP